MAFRPGDVLGEIAVYFDRQVFVAIAQLVRRMLLEIVHEFDVRFPVAPHKGHIGIARIVVRTVEQFESELVGVERRSIRSCR